MKRKTSQWDRFGQARPGTGDESRNYHIQDARLEWIFREIKTLFTGESIPMILLKGPHLAHSYYDQPHERPYGDLDLLVRPCDFKRAAGALAAHGYVRLESDERSLATLARMNHWAFRSPFGQLIELHRGFTGLERHPVDLNAWFARGEGFNYGQTPATGLGPEDLLCHLCLHMGKSFFYQIDPKHVRDLDVLVRRRKVDWEAFVRRCRETRSKTIAFYSLSAAMARFGTPVPLEVRAALRPGRWRRLWLDRCLDVSTFPIYRHPHRDINHARRMLTLPLLDGVGNWFPFLVRAAWVRGLDVSLRLPILRKWWVKKTGIRNSRYKAEKDGR